MNKNQIGIFLKELRKEKGLTQEGLVDQLEDYISISQKTISDWEKGKNLPSLETLAQLATLYGVSVDEILDGERYVEINNETIKYSRIETEERKNYILEQLSNNIFTERHDKELKYLIDKHFIINYNALTNNVYDDLKTQMSHIKFFVLKKNLFDIANKTNLTKEEKIFEMNKLLIPKLTNYELDMFESYDEEFKSVFKKFNNIEKDLIFSTFIYYVNVLLNENLSMYYDKSYLVKINHNLKDKIKFYIENGACLNRTFLSCFKENAEQKIKIIDRLEHIFEKHIKPFKINVSCKNEVNTYMLENNYKNYFYVNQFEYFWNNFDVSYSKFYELTKNKKILPKELIIDSANFHNLNTNLNYYDLCDCVYNTQTTYHAFDEKITKNEWNEILKEKEYLIDLLKNGEKYYSKNIIEIPNYNILELFYKNMEPLSLTEVLAARDECNTKCLYEDLNDLSIRKIRNKYFFELGEL